jgi:hypothetical protein
MPGIDLSSAADQNTSDLARSGGSIRMISPKSAFLGFLLALAATGGAGAASLSYDDILGNWCGSRSNPNWTNFRVSREQMIITHLPNRTRTPLKIDHFVFSDTDIVIFYLSAGTGTKAGTPGSMMSHVQFIRFGSDGQSMVQATSDVTGEYRFTRCDG